MDARALRCLDGFTDPASERFEVLGHPFRAVVNGTLRGPAVRCAYIASGRVQRGVAGRAVVGARIPPRSSTCTSTASSAEARADVRAPRAPPRRAGRAVDRSRRARGVGRRPRRHRACGRARDPPWRVHAHRDGRRRRSRQRGVDRRRGQRARRRARASRGGARRGARSRRRGSTAAACRRSRCDHRRARHRLRGRRAPGACAGLRGARAADCVLSAAVHRRRQLPRRSWIPRSTASGGR